MTTLPLLLKNVPTDKKKKSNLLFCFLYNVKDDTRQQSIRYERIQRDSNCPPASGKDLNLVSRGRSEGRTTAKTLLLSSKERSGVLFNLCLSVTGDRRGSPGVTGRTPPSQVSGKKTNTLCRTITYCWLCSSV